MNVVLVTGCSSGFGLEIVSAFARRGDRVVATMRDPSRSGELTRRLEAESLQDAVVIRRLDVTSGESMRDAVDETVRSEGRIDVLVNNAGIGAVGALEELEDTVVREVFETNVFGWIALTKAVLPHMRKQRQGRVVFMNAIGSILNTPYFGAYGATKHAMDCIAAGWDIELRPFGIRVSSILPGAYRTDIAGNMRVFLGEGSPYESATREFWAGLSERLTKGPSDLSPVVDAVIEAATSPDPRLRYLVAPRLADVLNPVVEELEQLHRREVSLAPTGAGQPKDGR